MSAPTRPKLLPQTSHQSTRYEVDILDSQTGQWYLAHMRKTLEGAKAVKKRIDDRGGYHTRLVSVSETRRLITGDLQPSSCKRCEILGHSHVGNCDSSGSLGNMGQQP